MIQRRSRWATVFGWIAGGLGGLLVNFGLEAVVGEWLPLPITTFVFFVAGAFAGMAVADRLGERGFRFLAISTGILLALAILSLALLLGARG